MFGKIGKVFGAAKKVTSPDHATTAAGAGCCGRGAHERGLEQGITGDHGELAKIAAGAGLAILGYYTNKGAAK